MRLITLRRPPWVLIYLADAPLAADKDVRVAGVPYLEAHVGRIDDAATDAAPTVHVTCLSVPPPLRGRGHATRLLGECARFGDRVTLDDASDRCRAQRNVYMLAGLRYTEAAGPEMAASARHVMRVTARRQRAFAERAAARELAPESSPGV